MAGFKNPHLETGCPGNPFSRLFLFGSLVMCSLVIISDAFLDDKYRRDDLAQFQSSDHFG